MVEFGLLQQVSTLEVLPAAQGKRLQTGTCREVTKKIYIDIREDQSWTLPPGGQMLNLYQRQCLTIDRCNSHWILKHILIHFLPVEMLCLVFARRYG